MKRSNMDDAAIVTRRLIVESAVRRLRISFNLSWFGAVLKRGVASSGS